MQMLQQLKNNRGESLAEVLIAVLIIAAGLLALAGMVRVATRTVSNSKTTVGHFYTAENAIEEKNSGTSAKANIGGSTVDIDVFTGSYNTAGNDSNKKYVYRYEVQ